ncbi:MAG TPA: glycosyltransferase family 39 protein [Roseiflexaceae bacterium]|nr:glycosyltransferase family 39 protein [Roseiflexaceae bacterium]
MRRDLTTSSAGDQDIEKRRSSRASWRLGDATLLNAAGLLAAMVFGALLLALVYQIPVTHTVDIGGYDAAYVQGFYDPERGAGPDHPELAGSDGGARWTRATSYLLFPQAGLPAQLTLRIRGWRPSGPAPNVQVLLNGTTLLGQFRAGADWEDHSFQISNGLLKPNDVVIELRSETARPSDRDSREVGVLLDRATFHAGPAPITPYPPQLAYGALAAGMLWLLTRHDEGRRTKDEGRISRRLSWFVNRRSSRWLIGTVCLAVGFLLLYRAQLPYPYPLLRLLPAIGGGLAALLAIRHAPALARRVPALPDALAIGGVGVWLVAVLSAAGDHVVLSAPGVEKDFGVFARRSAHLLGAFPAGINDASLDGVLRADGFYNLGYPLLLWLTRPFTSDNPFLAARLIAALSGAVLLLSSWWLARRVLGRNGALLALLVLALSPLVVQYALYLGTDMPFAAACGLALALLIGRPANDDRRTALGGQAGAATSKAGRSSLVVVLAGLAVGAAFLIRHPGLLLLPFGWLVIWRSSELSIQSSELLREHPKSKIQNPKSLLLFTLGFLLAISPQIAVNLRDTASPLFNQQAKNVWQGVFGDGDWGRWAATANDITLGRVIAQDPARFAANWWANVRGYFGTGGEDAREFGQATQLRLLSFPANWLAIAGLLGWLVLGFRHLRYGDTETTTAARSSVFSPQLSVLLVWVLLYVLTISVGLAPQMRFFLPLAPIYALAAAWTVAHVLPILLGEDTDSAPRESWRLARSLAGNAPLIAGIVLLALLWGGFAAGAAYVTRVRTPADDNAPGQPADEVAAAMLVLQTLRGDDRLVLQPPQGSLDGLSLGKYSAIADRVAASPANDDLASLRATGAGYLLRATTLGPPPGELGAVGTAGGYTLYTIPQ